MIPDDEDFNHKLAGQVFRSVPRSLTWIEHQPMPNGLVDDMLKAIEEASPPIRTQQEVSEHFWPKLQHHGKTYSKRVTAYIRKGIREEEIVMTINGKEEERYSIANDDTYVVRGKVAGESYCISSKEFQDNYITDSTMKPESS